MPRDAEQGLLQVRLAFISGCHCSTKVIITGNTLHISLSEYFHMWLADSDRGASRKIVNDIFQRLADRWPVSVLGGSCFDYSLFMLFSAMGVVGLCAGTVVTALVRTHFLFLFHFVLEFRFFVQFSSIFLSARCRLSLIISQMSWHTLHTLRQASTLSETMKNFNTSMTKALIVQVLCVLCVC